MKAKAEMQRLNKIASEKGLSYYRIAQLTGLHQSTVGRVMSGKFEPRLNTYMKLKEAIENA